MLRSPPVTPQSDPIDPRDTSQPADIDTLARQIAYEMAYGLSHELNNPLANIAARARLLAEQESDSQKRLVLSAIVDQAMRGCEMIADLMHFARPPSLTIQSVDAQLLVDQLLVRMQPWCDQRGLQLRHQRTLNLQGLAIHCDSIAFAESLWAIARNAIEVARQCITLTVDVTSDKTLRLYIEDDGPGLSDQALEKAFHPYFSGREAGRGLGLGLSKAQRNIHLMKGTLSLINQESGGCEAVIEMQIADSR